MRINELLNINDLVKLDPIKKHCGQFLAEAAGRPVFKQLPPTYQDFQKVKARKRKHTTVFSETFNGAFKDEINDLRQRAIFASGMPLINTPIDESFYIFPIDGYKYLYSKDVADSTKSYNQVLDSIFFQLQKETAQAIFTDLLKLTYISEDLSTGIDSGAELIIYKIPYYFAVRESCVETYEELLTIVT